MDLARSILLFGFIIGCGAQRLVAAPASTSEAAVQLPALVVTDSVKWPWLHARIPGYEVISSCSERATRGFLEPVQMEAAMLRALFPDGFLPEVDTPILLIVQREAPGVPSIYKDGWLGTSLSDAVNYDTAVFIQNAVIFETDPDCVRYQLLSAARNQIRWLLDCRKPQPPDWFGLGLFSILRVTLMDREERSVRFPDWTPPARPDLRRLLVRSRGDAGAEPSRSVREAIELDAATFVLWGVQDKEYRARFWTFVTRASSENVTEALFRECFGFGFDEANRHIMRSFPKVNGPYAVSIAAKDTAPVEFRAARRAEVGRIVAEWQRLRANVETDPKRRWAGLQQATQTLAQTMPRDPDPAFLSTLGLCEVDGGNGDDAVLHLEAAVQGKVVRPRAYLEYARLLYVKAARAPDRGAGGFSAAQAKAILEPLRAARRQQPPLTGVYKLIADVLNRSELQLTNEDLTILEEGTRFFPQLSSVAVAAIRLHAKAGRNTEAAAIAKRWLANADERTRAQLQAAIAEDRVPAAGDK